MSTRRDRNVRVHKELFTELEKLRIDMAESGEVPSRVEASKEAARMLRESRLTKPSRRFM